MRLSDQSLRVVPNPFAAPLDSKGRACALVPVDPNEGGSGYVGARSTAKEVERSPRQARRFKSPFGKRDKVSVAYDMRPRNVPDTGYYRAKIASGELLEVNQGTDLRLAQAAKTALDGFPGDRSAALKAMREQGLGCEVDVIEGVEKRKADRRAAGRVRRAQTGRTALDLISDSGMSLRAGDEGVMTLPAPGKVEIKDIADQAKKLGSTKGAHS